MKLTTKGQYAIVAVTNMKKRLVGKVQIPVTIGEISKDEKLPHQYLEQIFGRLRRAKIVASVRGPGGGYILVNKKVNYKEILEAVGEKISFSEDITDRSKASNDVKVNLNSMYRSLAITLEQTTV